MWKWLTAAAVLVLATGLLPAGQALDVTARIGPVLVFLAAITIVAELADAAGVFTAAADRAARLPPAPFAVLTLWLADTASLLLPVSNLTNLLAADRLARLNVPFTRLMAAS